jgi:hypothetical protein
MKTEEFDGKIKTIIESEDESFPRMINRQAIIDEIISRKSRKAALIKLCYYAAACLLILIAVVVFWQNNDEQPDCVDLVEDIMQNANPEIIVPEIIVPEIKTDIESQKVTVPAKKKTVKNRFKTVGDSLNNIPKIADLDIIAKNSEKNDDETVYIILLKDSIFLQLYQALYQPERANNSDINIFSK